MIVMDGQPNLLEVVGAAGPTGSLACGLHSRKQQTDKDADDGDDDEKLHEREAGAALHGKTSNEVMR